MWRATGGAVFDMIRRLMSIVVLTWLFISENIIQVIMTINGIIYSLLLDFVLICLHESQYVLYNASREAKI